MKLCLQMQLFLSLSLTMSLHLGYFKTLLRHLPDTVNHKIITNWLFTWREEDPRRWIILAPYVFCIQFTCKKLYLSLALGSS